MDYTKDKPPKYPISKTPEVKSSVKEALINKDEVDIEVIPSIQDAKAGKTFSHRFDYNLYATKKSAAEGLFDLALLMANASQLKLILMSGGQHHFYTLMLTLLIGSIVVQVFVGIALLVLARMRVRILESGATEEEVAKALRSNHQADMLNNFVVAAIFILTVINIFISAFGLSDSKPLIYRDS